MVKHYVEYVCPAIRSPILHTMEIEERDVSKVTVIDGCSGFRFFDITEIEFEGEILRGERKNISGWYYRGEKMNIEVAIKLYKNDDIQYTHLTNYKYNGCSRVCKLNDECYSRIPKGETIYNRFVPLMENDSTI